MIISLTPIDMHSVEEAELEDPGVASLITGVEVTVAVHTTPQRQHTGDGYDLS